MDATEILVVIGGIGLIALTLWYFFDEREAASAERNLKNLRKKVNKGF